MKKRHALYLNLRVNRPGLNWKIYALMLDQCLGIVKAYISRRKPEDRTSCIGRLRQASDNSNEEKKTYQLSSGCT